MSEHQIQWGDSESKYPCSMLIVYGKQEIYTSEEVEKIREVSEELTNKHLKKYNLRDWGWNFYWLEKLSHGMWLSKRATHEHGKMFSSTLDEALEWFRFLDDLLPDGYEMKYVRAPLGKNSEMVPVNVSYSNGSHRLVPRG